MAAREKHILISSNSRSTREKRLEPRSRDFRVSRSFARNAPILLAARVEEESALPYWHLTDEILIARMRAEISHLGSRIRMIFISRGEEKWVRRWATARENEFRKKVRRELWERR